MKLGVSTLAGRRVRTAGISPKVTIPAAVTAVAGIALLVVGIATGNDAVRDLGIGALGAVGIHVPVGFASGVGNLERAE